MPSLRREDDYLVATSDDRRHYEDFRELLDSSHYPQPPMPSCPLLLKFMKAKEMPILLVQRFNCELVITFPSSRINELCDWAQSEIANSESGCVLALHYVRELQCYSVGTYMRVQYSLLHVCLQTYTIHLLKLLWKK